MVTVPHPQLNDARLLSMVDGHPDAAPARDADLFLIGSRATGRADAHSDYDLVALTARAVPRTEVTLTPEVSLVILGPAAREQREESAGWLYDIAHARPIRAVTDLGRAYRQHVEEVWRVRRPAETAALRAAAEASLRRSAAAVRHGQELAAFLLAAEAVTTVMKLIVTAREVGRPNDKWLPAVVAGLAPEGPAVVAIGEQLARGASSPAVVEGRLRALLRDPGR